MEEVVDIVSVELASPPDDRVRLDGFKLIDKPLGDTENSKLTVPVNPFRLVRVMVVVIEDPWVRLTILRPEVIEKSGWGEALIMAVMVTA